MKYKNAFFLLIFSATNLYAAEDVKYQLVTNGQCSPAIGINNGQVTINCTDKELEAKFDQLPDLTNYNNNMSQLASLRNDAANLNTNLQRLRHNYSLNTQTIDELKNSLNSMSSEYQKLKRHHEMLRFQLANKLSHIDEIIRDESVNSVSIMTRSIAEAVIDQQFERYSKTVILDIDDKLSDNQIEVNKLAFRVAALESDVSFLMIAFLDGKLEDKKSFFGISLGSHYLTESWQPSLSLEYELLLPKIEILGSRGSLYLDLTWLDWQETSTFQSLPGAAPITVQNDSESVIFSLGGRLFAVNWSPSTHTYIGALFGHTIEGEDDYFYYGLSIGTEYFTTDRRISFELRLETMPDIDNEIVDFNPLGNATITKTEDSESGFYIGVRFSFR